MIVITSATQLAVTPAGSPVGEPIPVAPDVVCVMGVSAVFTHNVGVVDAGPAEQTTIMEDGAIPLGAAACRSAAVAPLIMCQEGSTTLVKHAARMRCEGNNTSMIPMRIKLLHRLVVILMSARLGVIVRKDSAIPVLLSTYFVMEQRS